MNFWDTVLGNRLAETLVRELPRLTNREQYCKEVAEDKVSEYIKGELDRGSLFVNAIPTGNGFLIIMER